MELRKLRIILLIARNEYGSEHLDLFDFSISPRKRKHDMVINT